MLPDCRWSSSLVAASRHRTPPGSRNRTPPGSRTSTPYPPISTPDSRAESFHTAHSVRTANSRQTCTTNSSAPDPEVLALLLADLGIESWEEDEFGWIAEVGLQTPPPPRWASRYDAESGAHYFVDTDTQTSTWDNPLVPHLRKVVEAGREYMQNPLDGGVFEEQKRVLWSEHKTELDCWHGPMEDDEGNHYFVNSKEGISSWQDPRIGAQYIFDVQCGLLRHLQSILSAAEDPDGAASFLEGGTPWETDDGAQVLTLESSVSSRKLARISRAMSQQENITPTLHQMSTAANWLHDARQNEEEVQRLRLIRKVEERRVRKLSRRLSKAIHETVQVQSRLPESERGLERRMAWTAQAKLASEAA